MSSPSYPRSYKTKCWRCGQDVIKSVIKAQDIEGNDVLIWVTHTHLTPGGALCREEEE